MVECVERVVRCPYREAWTSGRSGRTAREHAEWFVPTTKTWSNSTFKAALRSIMLTSTYLFADILALEKESRILGRCWALSEFHISSRFISNQFLSTVLVCGVTPTNWIEGK